LQRIFLYGYGINDPRGRALRLDNPLTYLYYVRKLGNEHLSFALFVLLIAVLVAAVAVTVRQQGTIRRSICSIRTEGWVVLTWLCGAYLLLSLSIYQETRALTPVIPAVALLLGAGLLRLPWRSVRWGLLVLIVVIGLVQFAALSYEPASRLVPRLSLNLPIWGQTSLPPEGPYLQLPDEGPTDRRFWIHPDVLRRMEAHRQSLGAESLSMGLLARSRQLNAGGFIYLILAEYPNLRVESLIDDPADSVLRQRIFAHDYLLVKANNVGINVEQEEAIHEILSVEPTDPGLLHRTYELDSSYSLPDGDTAYLFRQRFPLPSGYSTKSIERLAQQISPRTRPGDAILVTPPQLVAPFAANYVGPGEIYYAAETEAEMAAIAAAHERIFLVLGDASAGPVQQLAQDWLDQNGFRAAHEWADNQQILTYGTGAETPPSTPTVVAHAKLGDQVELTGYHLPSATWQQGDVVPITLSWQAYGPIEEDYHIFVHLIGSDGQVVAQTDSPPVAGARPTSSWSPATKILDRHGLALPDDLPPGRYELRVGLYRPSTGERLPVYDSENLPMGDYFPLGRLLVGSP
jgi:hypothetical protein